MQALDPLVGQHGHVVGQRAAVAPAAQLRVRERRQLLAVAVLLAPEERAPRRGGGAPPGLAFQRALRATEDLFDPGGGVSVGITIEIKIKITCTVAEPQSRSKL